MTKRIEQSRTHGPHDPRWTNRADALSDVTWTDEPDEPDEPDAPENTPPILRLVGGTEFTPEIVAAPAVPQE